MRKKSKPPVIQFPRYSCAKQPVLAIIVNNGRFYTGWNATGVSQAVCPREMLQYKTGEGYFLCKNPCKQKNHAEVAACLKAGKHAKGGTMYLIGHTYCCDECKKVLDRYGIKEVKFNIWPTNQII